MADIIIHTNLIILVTPGVVWPHAGDKIQDIDQRSVRVGVSAQSEVTKCDVVVGSNMARCDSREERLVK
jgi:hypothetical protein